MIYKVDRTNAERLRQKKAYESRKGDWKRPATSLTAAEREEVITLSELAKEGQKLLQAKKEREAKEMAESENYRAKLRKIYKFRKFKDDPKIEKMIQEVLLTVDPAELEQYEKLLPGSRKRRNLKKPKFKIEAQTADLDKSYHDEEESSKSYRSLRSAGVVEVDIEDTEFDLYASGINDIIDEIAIPNIIGDERVRDGLAKKDQVRVQRQQQRKAKEGKAKAAEEPLANMKEVRIPSLGRQGHDLRHRQDYPRFQRQIQ